MQPIDVSINKPFKAAVDREATAHMQANLTDYVQARMSVSVRRVLLTKWIANAWEETAAKRETVIRSFRKVGILVAVDGTKDEQINIEGIEKYRVDSSVDEYRSDEDALASSDDDSNCQPESSDIDDE